MRCSGTVSLLSAAVTKELPLLALLLLCLPAHCTLLPQHSLLMNASVDVDGGLITTHFSPKYTAVLVGGEPYRPSSSGAQKREGLQ